MLEFHLRQQEFTYSAYGTFTKHCEKVQKFIEAENLKQYL